MGLAIFLFFKKKGAQQKIKINSQGDMVKVQPFRNKRKNAELILYFKLT